MGADGLRGARALKAAGGDRPQRGRGDLRRLRHAARVEEAGLSDVVQPLGDLAAAVGAVIARWRRRVRRVLQRPAPPDRASTSRQYKRQQMERRIRTYVERKAAPTLAAFLRHIQTSPRRPRRLPRPDHDQRLRAVPEPGAVRAAAHEGAAGAAPAPAGLRIWSAGCSYGAEAYTLASLLAETRPQRGFQVARHGHRPPRRWSAPQRGWFSDGRHAQRPAAGPRALLRGRATAAPRRRRACAATCGSRREDLLKRPVREPAGTSCCCRNVVIYFTDAARDHVHRGIARALRPGGYLMVGATERVADPRAIGLEPVHPFIYRKAV